MRTDFSSVSVLDSRHLCRKGRRSLQRSREFVGLLLQLEVDDGVGELLLKRVFFGEKRPTLG